MLELSNQNPLELKNQSILELNQNIAELKNQNTLELKTQNTSMIEIFQKLDCKLNITNWMIFQIDLDI